MCQIAGDAPEYAISVFSRAGLSPEQVAALAPIQKIDNISVTTAGAVRQAGYVIRADEAEIEGHYLIVFPQLPTRADGERLRAIFTRRRVTRGN